MNNRLEKPTTIKKHIYCGLIIIAMCLIFAVYMPLSQRYAKETASAKTENAEGLHREKSWYYRLEKEFEANAEVISKIMTTEWESLGAQERLAVCQTIVDCDARSFGIPFDLTVETSELLSVDGCDRQCAYNPTERKIVIDRQLLLTGRPYEVLRALFHGCAHAYQQAQVSLFQSLDERTKDMLLFRDVSIYEKEFLGTINSIEGFSEPYYLSTERDARYHANDDATELIRMIFWYLEETQDAVEN